MEFSFKIDLLWESMEKYPERNCYSNLQCKYSSSCNDNKSLVNLHTMESMIVLGIHHMAHVLHWQTASTSPQTYRHRQTYLFSSYHRSQPFVFAELLGIWVFSCRFLGFQRNLFVWIWKKIDFCLCLILRIMTNWNCKN